MIRDFFEELTDAQGKSCIIPGTTESLAYGDECGAKARTASSITNRACGYEAADKDDQAIQEWEKVFGREFGE
jgi:hypothetical protein